MSLDPRVALIDQSTVEGRDAAALAALERRLERLERGSRNAVGWARGRVDAETSTASAAKVDLGGPSVTLDIADEAFVCIFADVEIKGGGGPVSGSYYATVWLYDGNVDFGSGHVLLSSEDAAFFQRKVSTPGLGASHPYGDTFPHGGFKAFPATPGSRTYSLRYSASSEGYTSYFRNRRLWAFTL